MRRRLHITQTLPQFTNERALFIVTGTKSLELYEAMNGTIENVLSYRIEAPECSDKEGHFAKRRGGKTLASGAVREDVEASLRVKFLRQLESSLQTIMHSGKVTAAYIFSPQHMMNDVVKVMPRAIQKQTKKVVQGNFTKLHPFEVLQKIVDKGEEKVQVITSEAMKLLQKAQLQTNLH